MTATHVWVVLHNGTVKRLAPDLADAQTSATGWQQIDEDTWESGPWRLERRSLADAERIGPNF